MKLFKYGMSLAALALLASCANDNVTDPGDQTQVFPDGSMYAAFNIVLPVTNGNGARAVEYQAGTAEEYAANTGMIYLFKAGTSAGEDNYVYVSEAPLSLGWNNGSDDIERVSTTATAKFTVAEMGALANEYYALVVLNKSTDFPEPKNSTNFGTWKKTAHSNVGTLEGVATNFVMTNAPGSEEAINPAVVPNTLVKIEKSSFKPSPNNLPVAASIYVQREVAKVEMVDNTGENKTWAKFGVDGTDGKDFIRFDAWELDITNNSTYPVQVIDGVTGIDGFTTWITDETNHSGANFYATGKTFNRVWWAIDPNYNGAVSGYGDAGTQNAVFTKISYDQVANKLSGDQKKLYDYARENTMEYNYMNLNQTTSVWVKGTYFVGKAPEEGDGSSFVVYGTYKAAVPASTLGAGQKGITLAALYEGSAENLATAKAALGVTDDNTTVDYYHNGITYYRIPIRHFEDSESAALDESWKTDTDAAYEKVHRGRFGLLRNNWYQITINSVSGLGEPTIPDNPPTTPDDPKQENWYINASINILAWAKRAHGYDL
ncbi:MAG: Mfa1 fimbrilin C-terminal domain-containing protein [Muribaculaceae bacterium]|nr:Mfa1 fimbrilin C-terminal domain-containing protein [Muribaculaceae bacterium]